VTVGAHGIELGSAELIAYRDDAPEPIALPATRSAGGFTLTAPLAGDPVYLAIVADGQRWLVTQQARRGY
jgi:hypothetical protein